MKNQSLFALLFIAMAGCAGEADPAEHVDTEHIVSAQSTRSFFASAGNGVVIRVVDIGHTAASPAFTVFDPAGNTVVSAWGTDVAGSTFQAAVTGNYSISIHDNANPPVIGAVFTLYLAVAPGTNTGGALPNAGVMLGHIDEGEVDSYTFTANAGEGILLRLTDLAGSAFTPWFTVYGPAGNVVTSARGTDVAGRDFAAPSTGTYTVVVYDSTAGLAQTGDYHLYFTRAPGANKGGALPSGHAVLGHIDEGEVDSYTFTASAGEGILLRLTDLAGGAFTPWFTVYGPAGNVVTSARGTDVAERSFVAPSTGTYTVVVYDSTAGLAQTGDYELDYVKTP
jgi:hypothetical protein